METFSLTRYLYITIEVKQSLLLAILDSKLDEALFWAFELYYSNDFVNGISVDDSTYSYILDIYDELFQKYNPGIEKWINTKLVDVDPAIAIGSIIQTLVGRQYGIADFIGSYLHIKCKDNVEIILPNKKLCIILCDADISKYKTIESIDILPRDVLKIATRFSIRKNANLLFNTYIPDNLLDIWFNKWLYYASKSPIWLHRIQEFDGVVNDELQTVEFNDDDYDNDTTQFEQFYLKWNYEPDEQGIELRYRIIGLPSAIQMNVQTFCLEYNAEIPTKKIKCNLST
jgi:hypothetical protein